MNGPTGSWSLIEADSTPSRCHTTCDEFNRPRSLGVFHKPTPRKKHLWYAHARPSGLHARAATLLNMKANSERRAKMRAHRQREASCFSDYCHRQRIHRATQSGGALTGAERVRMNPPRLEFHERMIATRD